MRTPRTLLITPDLSPPDNESDSQILRGIGKVEGNDLGYLHVMQPFLDRVGLLGGVSPSRRLSWVDVGLSPFMLGIGTS